MEMKKKLVLLCGLAFGIACQQPLHKETHNDYSIEGDTIMVFQDSPLSKKIKTIHLIEEPYRQEITTAASVKAIPTQIAQIAPPFSGRVIKSYMAIGQPVTQHSPLFEISSADFIGFQKAFFQAQSDYYLAFQTLTRQKDLIENGVGTQKGLEEAQNKLDLATQEYKNTAQAIKIFNVDPERMTMGQNLVVRSPLSGNIVENKLIVGQFLKEDGEYVAIVAELSKVWIVAQVKEKDIRHIHKNDEVEIQISAYPDLNLKGKVFHIQELINAETHAIEVLIESENPQLILKQGMFVTAKFKSKEVNKIMLPEEAVLQDENTAFVYVKSAENSYMKRKIKVNTSISGKIVVESGLNADELVVSEGGYYLLNAY
jgi:cobalt-zinc-cadmium efflux system membrane fusion protein